MNEALTTEHENRRHPEAPRFFQRGEGSPSKCTQKGDPSLRPKNGSAQDDPNWGFRYFERGTEARRRYETVENVVFRKAYKYQN